MITQQGYILWALLYRDLRVFTSDLVSRFLDGIAIVALQIVEFGYLLPLMGLSPQLVGPLFLGTLVVIVFHMGFALALRHLYDLKFNRFIDYYLTLPIPRHLIFISFIISFFIEVSLIAIPLLATGIFILSPHFFTVHINVPALIGIYTISLIFLGLLFLYLPFTYTFEWFNDNIWPRRLSPLFFLSTVFFPLKQVRAFSPLMGRLFLLNPLTYVTDGLRSAFIGGPDFISAWWCIAALIPCTALLMIGLMIQARKKLDLV